MVIDIGHQLKPPCSSLRKIWWQSGKWIRHLSKSDKNRPNSRLCSRQCVGKLKPLVSLLWCTVKMKGCSPPGIAAWGPWRRSSSANGIKTDPSTSIATARGWMWPFVEHAPAGVYFWISHIILDYWCFEEWSTTLSGETLAEDWVSLYFQPICTRYSPLSPASFHATKQVKSQRMRAEFKLFPGLAMRPPCSFTASFKCLSPCVYSHK